MKSDFLWMENCIFKRAQVAKKNFYHVAIIFQSSKLEINTIELRNELLLSIGEIKSLCSRSRWVLSQPGT